ncbi:MAG: transporter substrate-binding domain-containing protein [Gammaproteobacteria bacterium]|nr:transporter substrate-binding domain-containing protein [Gammaproteobacteria bacterium]
MKNIVHIVGGICFLMLASTPYVLAMDIVLTTGIHEPLVDNENREGFVESVLEEAFRRIGMRALIEIEPSKLSLINANSGKDDGVALRIKGIDEKYKNLVRVPEVIMCSEFIAYSKENITTLKSWSDLNKYSVSHVNGWRIFERNLGNRKNVRKSDSARQLFTMLRDDRTEVVLYEKWQGKVLAQQVGLQDIKENKLPISAKRMYIYLHKKHASIIASVASAMREMKSDGTYQRIYNSTLSQYADKAGTDRGYQQQMLSNCE